MCAGIDRLNGFQAGLPSNLRSHWRELVALGNFTEESGEAAMSELLERVPDLDAVFAANDLTAAGALHVLKAAGRKVPDDVALVGFDDSSIARHTDPQLTSVRQPIEELGRNMVRLLLMRLQDGVAPEPMVLPTELVIRASAWPRRQQRHGIARHHLAIPASAVFAPPLMRFEIDVHDAETLVVAECPFEVVEKRLAEITADVGTIDDRQMHGDDVIAQIVGAFDVVNLAVIRRRSKPARETADRRKCDWLCRRCGASHRGRRRNRSAYAVKPD